MGASGALSCFLARAAVPRLGMGSLMSPLTKTSGKHLVLPRAYAFGVHCGKLGSWGVHGVLQDLLDLPNQPDQSAMSVHQHPEYPEKLGVASICKTYFPPSEKKKLFFLLLLHSPFTRFPQGQWDCSAAWGFAWGELSQQDGYSRGGLEAGNAGTVGGTDPRQQRTAGNSLWHLF